MAGAGRRPLIGVNTTFERNAEGEITAIKPKYWRAIERAGGVPVLIPQLEDAEALRAALDCVDGFVMIGGYDLKGERWGERTLPQVTPIEPEREATDFALLKLLKEMNKPTLAICLGCQELNVACGGTLYQDLPTDGPASTVQHKDSDGVVPRHAVEIEPGSRVAKALGADGRIEVNSRHHQGIARIGDGLRVTARSEDGLAEALEFEGHSFLVGVQWHPEEMTDDGRQLALFAGLIEAARGAGIS